MLRTTLVDISLALWIVGAVACGGRAGTDPADGGSSTGGTVGSGGTGSSGATGSGTGAAGNDGTGGRGGASGMGGNGGTSGIDGTGDAGAAAGRGGGAGIDGGSGTDGPAGSAGTGGAAGIDGGGGTGGIAGTGGAGGSGGPVPPNSGNACWRKTIPDAEPILTTVSVAEACDRAVNSSSWVIVGPQADAGLGDKNDNKGFLVGRWVACAPGAPAAIEFGTNNRWRHLVRAGSGEYEPVPGNPITSRGHFYLLSANGQLELIDDRRLHSIVNSTVPQGSGSAFVATLPNREAMQISGGAEMILPAGFYARMAPSPLLGWDNAPSTEAPPCKLVGTWDATSATGGTSRDASFSFDDAGHFVGAPGRNVDLCSAPTMYGTYELTSGAFQLTTNVGMGACSFWYAAGYQITFSGSCTIATLERPAYDNCTGGRGYFNEPTTLFKRL